MNKEEIESAALKLDPKARANLASRLLESLETLSPEEHAEIWAEEALRRDAEMTRNEGAARDASDVFRKARARLA
jgi:hypothetical protein